MKNIFWVENSFKKHISVLFFSILFFTRDIMCMCLPDPPLFRCCLALLKMHLNSKALWYFLLTSSTPHLIGLAASQAHEYSCPNLPIDSGVSVRWLMCVHTGRVMRRDERGGDLQSYITILLEETTTILTLMISLEEITESSSLLSFTTDISFNNFWWRIIHYSVEFFFSGSSSK